MPYKIFCAVHLINSGSATYMYFGKAEYWYLAALIRPQLSFLHLGKKSGLSHLCGTFSHLSMEILHLEKSSSLVHKL